MNKKELRKELEAMLEKSIAETLNNRNAIAGKKMAKTVHETSKTIAKKFYKILKSLADQKPAPSKRAVTKARPVKRAAAKRAPVKKK